METKDALCEALKTAFDEIKKHGQVHTSLHDGKIYTCFLLILQTLIQDRTKNLVPANQLVMTMQHLLDDPGTPSIVKENIQKIFAAMDPRDQNYRFSKDCDCPICKPSPAFRKLWKKLVAKIKNATLNPN